MKKFMCMIMVIVFLIGATVNAYAWGNQSWFDTTYNFNRVQIAMPDGSIIEGKVQSWMDYEDSDIVQVKVDNKVYLTHYMNVVLISE